MVVLGGGVRVVVLGWRSSVDEKRFQTVTNDIKRLKMVNMVNF